MKELTKLISPTKFDKLADKGLTLDHIYLLVLAKDGKDITTFNNLKIKALCQGLERKSYTIGGEVTPSGDEILEFVFFEDVKEPTIVKRKEKDEAFEKWWNAYPRTNKLIIGKKKFEGDRALRIKREECKTKLKKILAEGEYTVDQLIAALNYEIELKKKKSIQTGENKMTYMVNSLSYLNQRIFESFIEEASQKDAAVILESKTKIMDI